MFESTATLGDDDLELDTSFRPILSSTQEPHCTKRRNEAPVGEVSKKCRVEAELQTKSPFIRNLSSENSDNHSFRSPSKVVKRMFPGPAGLLTDQFRSFKQNSELLHKDNSGNEEDFLLCSQQTVTAFADGPWKMMEEDFHTSNREQLFEKFTVGWIKRNFSHKKALNDSKAPFLAAIIQNVDTVDGKIPSVHVTLKDTTGVIDGTILYSFYKENSKYLTIGSVIILKQFGVLSSQEGHCLTITSNNLIVIYHVKDPTSKEVSNETDPVNKIILHNCTADEIWKEANSASAVKNILKRSTNVRPQFSNVYNNRKNVVQSKTVKNSEVLCRNKFSPKVNDRVSNFVLPKVTVNNPNISNPSVLNDITRFETASCQSSEKKKFNLKNNSSIQDRNNLNASNMKSDTDVKVQTDDVWKTMLEDVDADSLFGDF